MVNPTNGQQGYSRFPRRKPNRLRGYDYTRPGTYFITICAYQRQMLFGDVIDGKMVYNSIAEAIRCEILSLADHYENVFVDSWCIMPNHLHLLIRIDMQPEGTSFITPDDNAVRPAAQRPSLGNIVRGFKAGVSRRTGIRVWQRNYHDHIVRDANELEKIQLYIQNNPAKWEEDRHHPAHPKYHEFRDVPSGLVK